MLSAGRLRFLANRISERLWVKPLAVCLLSIAGVVFAKVADETNLGHVLPVVTGDSLESLLELMGASMLVIATFAVSSMVSAYASASRTATPRAFTLIVRDDLSQNALSTFIGAFIFSIVALTAVLNRAFEEAGRSVLFGLTILVFCVVILMFVRWVDQIARLGRVANSIERVEAAASNAISRRRRAPALGGMPARRQRSDGRAVTATTVGYVQRVDVAALQACAEETGGWVAVAVLPGTFATPTRPLAYVGLGPGATKEIDDERVARAFVIGRERLFDEDPRFGLVVLSEIADKALSPGINDPGTAIAVLGSLTRLFVLWAEPREMADAPPYPRVEVPELSVRDMFDDAFTAIARDGAGAIEVVVRLRKTLTSLASLGDPAMHAAALAHGRMALARAERALHLPEELALARRTGGDQ